MIRGVGWLATFIFSVPTAVLVIALVLGTFIPVGTLEPAQKPGINNQTITSLNTSGSVVVNNFAWLEVLLHIVGSGVGLVLLVFGTPRAYAAMRRVEGATIVPGG